MQGRGDIIIGDDVTIDGKCSFSFAVRYAERPTLEVGDHTGIGHNVSVTVGRSVRLAITAGFQAES